MNSFLPADRHALVTQNDDDNGFVSSTALRFNDDFDSTCSTPYVSAPSSPGRDPAPHGYFFSAPASPMHFVLSSAASSTSEPVFLATTPRESSTSEFEFSSRFSSEGVVATGAMSSADELFLNGQIRPMKLSSHLQRPQILSPLRNLEAENDDLEILNRGEQVRKGRDLKLRSRSLHRKARSLSPLRNPEIEWLEVEEEEDEDDGDTEAGKIGEHILVLQDFEGKQSETTSGDTTPSCSASSSRSSSTGRNSKKWIFLKDLLYRSKSEGRGNGKENFQSSISFSPSKEKVKPLQTPIEPNNPKQKQRKKQPKQNLATKKPTGKPTNGVAKRRNPPSPHELHYTANRAQAEEMKKKTFLPYRQGLLGCLGFNSKGYGAISGLTRALNRPVSST